MISYHWECQKTMLLVKTRIDGCGQNEGRHHRDHGTNEAVEKSSIVQIAMSRGYQSSPNIADQVRLLALRS